MTLENQIKWLEGRCFRLMSWLVGKQVPTVRMEKKAFREQFLKRCPWARETYEAWREAEDELKRLKELKRSKTDDY